MGINLNGILGNMLAKFKSIGSNQQK